MKARSLYLFAPLSGALALIYQTLWQRELRLLLGSGPESFALTVALFLGGLFAGYFYFGQRSQDRSRRELFADLAGSEALIGLSAMATALFLEKDALNLPLSFIFILGPVFLMGCFLPICGQLLASLAPTTKPEASLYACHGLGAAAGAWLSGLYFLPRWGSVTILWAAGALHLALAVFFWALRYRETPAPKIKTPFDPKILKPLLRLKPSRTECQVFCAGFAGIGLQMLSYRIATLVIGDSSFIFSMVLGAFVLMIAVGGLLARKITGTTPWKYLLLLPFLNLFLLVLLTPKLPEAAAGLLKPLLSHEYGFFKFHVAVSLGVLLITGAGTVILAALTPTLIRKVTESPLHLGRHIGQLWAWNTLGCLLGTAGFGLLFFLIMDLKTALCVCALAVAFLALSFGLRPHILLPAFLIMAFAPWNLESLIHAEIQSGRVGWPETGYQVVAYEDAPLGSFAIAAFKVGPQSAYRLVANGRFEASTFSRHEYAARLVVNLPILFMKKDSLHSALIGLGGGHSLDAMNRQENVRHIDLYEISASVVRFQKFFFEEGKNPMLSDKVQLLIKDAFTGLRTETQPYDLISSEPSQLWAAGVAPLYTREFYTRVKNVMSPDGIFTQWIPSYAISDELFVNLLATWRESFPHTRAFLARGDLILLGSARELIASDAEKFSDFAKLELPPHLMNQGPGKILSVRSTELETRAWYDYLSGANLMLHQRLSK